MSSFCKSYSQFFSKNISIHALFNDQSFNDTLTNDIVSFEQLSRPELLNGKRAVIAYANSNASGESVHPRCLASTYAVRSRTWLGKL